MENVNSCCFVAKVKEINHIPGADNIELAIIEGWNCIVKRDSHKVGDLVAVATTDAVIPQKLSDYLGVTNYLRKGQRVRTVKLRGVYSECLILPLPQHKPYFGGEDMMDHFGITKWEPPVKTVQLGGGRKIRYKDNPNFHVYYKFPNLKNVPGMFNKEDMVEITRKIHGTNARYGIVKKTKLSLWDRVKKLFGNEWIDYEFVVGSHNVEKGSDSQGFYETNVWYDIEKKYNIKEELWNYVKHAGKNQIGEGITLYGEIYGPGIQKGYEYGLKEIEFVGFDIKMSGEYLSASRSFYTIKNTLRLPYVPILYVGFWNQEVQDEYTFNNFIEGTKVPHEGIVIKKVSGERSKVAKVINPDYLIYSEKHNIGDSH
jgi:RNA ligase (TIGR02306 family)